MVPSYALSTDAFVDISFVDISYELIRPFLLTCARIPPYGFIPLYFATCLKTCQHFCLVVQSYMYVILLSDVIRRYESPCF